MSGNNNDKKIIAESTEINPLLELPARAGSQTIIKRTTRSKGSSILVALATFSTVSFLAYSNLLPNKGATYIHSSIKRDQIACIVTFLGATIFVKACTVAAKRSILSSRDTRKIIHTFSSPFYILCWPFFSNQYAARFFAGSIMIVFCFRLWVAGKDAGATDNSTSGTAEHGVHNGDSYNNNEESELAAAVSRSGDYKEAIGGPLFYGLNVLLLTITFWRDNLVGIIAITIMAAGDGSADLIGRRYGMTNKWPLPFCRDKSVVGSLAFFVVSFAFCAILSLWMMYTESIVYDYSMQQAKLFIRILLICFISTFVELLPIGDDNITVPIAAVLLSMILLP